MSTTPRLKGAKLVAEESVAPYYKIEVWETERGYYIYYRDPKDDSLVLARGPLKMRDYALGFARRLRDSLLGFHAKESGYNVDFHRESTRKP